MDEKDVRTLFFQLRAQRKDGDLAEVIAQGYLAVAIRIFTSLNLPSDGLYREAVHLVFCLKTDLCRKELYPGPRDLDPVPFGQEDGEVLLRALDAERQVLRYLCRHLDTLPPSPFKDCTTRDILERGLESRRLERERIVHDFIAKQYVMLPRSRVTGLAKYVDKLIEALLGETAHQQFCREFDEACAWIRQEQDRPTGLVN